MKFKNETRGGYPLTFYNLNAGGDRPIHAMIVHAGGQVVTDWLASGRYLVSGDPHPYDLLPLREPSEAAVEAVAKAWPDSVFFTRETILRFLTAAYAIDFPEGGE